MSGATDEERPRRGPTALEPRTVALSFDVQMSQLLYVATSAGELHIYNTKARARMPSGEFGNETKLTLSKVRTKCKFGNGIEAVRIMNDLNHSTSHRSPGNQVGSTTLKVLPTLFLIVLVLKI